ncbi:hypothetical protein GCM10022245_52580 [Streptomyces mayteni]
MDEPTARPFDAAVSLMAEEPASELSTWSAISLAKLLRDALLAPPSEREHPLQSREKIVDALKALAGGGLDGYAFARYGLGPKIAERIAGLASLPQLLNLVTPSRRSGEIDEILHNMPHEVTPWAQLCRADTTARPINGGEESNPEVLLLTITELTHDWHSRVQSWTQQADINNLIDWKCPTDDEFNTLVDYGTPDADLESQYAWVVDRLTETYLSDWEESSLHHEYRWLRAAAPIPFPDAIMDLRPISSAALNAEIAERAVMNQGDESQRETVAQLTFQGAELVKSGNRNAAASTFSLITRIIPENPNARNDLGFALIPDEPRKALRHLTAAARMGYDQPFINAHNRMVCNLLIDAQKDALYIAEATWCSSLTEQAVPALIWTDVEGQWLVQYVPDARVKVAELALQAARSLGGEAQETWQTRLVSLRSMEVPSRHR